MYHFRNHATKDEVSSKMMKDLGITEPVQIVKGGIEFDSDKLKRDTDILTKIYQWWYWKIWDKIVCFPREVKYFIQRGMRGYADCDLWNFNNYLTRIILEGLVWMKTNKNGYPATPHPNTGEWAYDEPRWDEVLTQMIDGFAIMMKCLDGDELEWGKGLSDADKKKWNEGIKKDGISCRLTTREEEMKAEKAMDLFKIYIWSLWD